MKSYTNSWGRKVGEEAAAPPGTYVNAFGRRVPVDRAATVQQEGGVHVNAYGRPVSDGYGAPRQEPLPGTRTGKSRQLMEAAEAEIVEEMGEEAVAQAKAQGKRMFIVEEAGRMIAPLAQAVA